MSFAKKVGVRRIVPSSGTVSERKRFNGGRWVELQGAVRPPKLRDNPNLDFGPACTIDLGFLGSHVLNGAFYSLHTTC
jgi:hypothetical protein